MRVTIKAKLHFAVWLKLSYEAPPNGRGAFLRKFCVLDGLPREYILNISENSQLPLAERCRIGYTEWCSNYVNLLGIIVRSSTSRVPDWAHGRVAFPPTRAQNRIAPQFFGFLPSAAAVGSYAAIRMPMHGAP